MDNRRIHPESEWSLGHVEGGEVFEAMKTRRAKIYDSEIGPTIAGWLKELVAELE